MEENKEIKQIISIEVKDSGVEKASKDVDKLSTSIDHTTESTEKLGVSQKSFKTQLREANAELQKAVQIYGATSAEAVKAAKGVAELKDTMGEAKDLAEAFNPDQKFKSLTAATQISATAISGVTSGMALFGDQSKDTEKTLLKVQAAMAFSESVSQLSQLGDQFNVLKSTIASSTLATKANAAGTVLAGGIMKLFGKSVDESSTSFKTLRGAIIGTGIGALVVGVGLLINNFDKVKEVVLKFVPGLADVGKYIGGIVDSITDFIGVTSESSRAIDKMKANADKSIALNKKFLDEHGSQLDEYTKQKLAAVDDYHNLLKEDGANQIALQEELGRKLAKIDKDRQDEIDKKRADAAEKERQRLEKLRKEEEEREKKAEADRIAKAKEDAARRQSLLEEQEEEQKRALGLIDNSYEEEEQRKTDHELAMADIAAKQRDIDFENEKTDKEAKLALDKQIQNSQLDIAEKGITLVKDVFGKSKAVQKGAIIADSAIGIGKMIIANNTANIGALATPQAIATSGASAAPIIALNNISTALGIAATVAATAKALSTVGGGTAPSSGGTQSIPARNAPQVGFQSSQTNQLANSIASKTNAQGPVQAFVVSQEVTDQQQFDKLKEMKNKI